MIPEQALSKISNYTGEKAEFNGCMGLVCEYLSLIWNKPVPYPTHEPELTVAALTRFLKMKPTRKGEHGDIIIYEYNGLSGAGVNLGYNAMVTVREDETEPLFMRIPPTKRKLFWPVARSKQWA